MSDKQTVASEHTAVRVAFRSGRTLIRDGQKIGHFLRNQQQE